MQDNEEPDISVRSAFAKRRLRHRLGLVLIAVVVVILVLLVTVGREAPALDATLWILVFALLGASIAVTVASSWRCPACRRFLGWRTSIRHCPSCAIRLR